MNQKQKFSELLEELKADYLNKLPVRIAELKESTAKKDWLQLEELYHNLKGTGKTYGFPEISQICEVMELFVNQKKPNTEKHAQDAINVLENLLNSYQTGQSVKLNAIPNALNIMSLKKK